jgi:hypothetical protein
MTSQIATSPFRDHLLIILRKEPPINVFSIVWSYQRMEYV